MEPLSRRSFFKRAGASAAVVGASAVVADLVPSAPAGASGTDYDAPIYDAGGQVFNVMAAEYGAKGDTIMASGGSISASSTSFSWSAGSFQSGDQGKVITVQGAGAAGAVLSTTISSHISSTEVILAAAAGTTVSAAKFAYGTDDTAAIVSCIIAAADNVLTDAGPNNGIVVAPPGVYMISNASSYQSNEFTNAGVATIPNQINIFGTIGLVGAGGKFVPGGVNANTVFLCATSGSGLTINGNASYQGFLVDGNNIATEPILQGLVGTNGGVTYGSAFMTFTDVWAKNSAGAGWTVYATQNNSYFHCGAINNATDGLYLDAGAGGLNFWNFQEANSGRYGIHADGLLTGGSIIQQEGYYNHTEDIRFFGGSLSSTPSGPSGVSKVYLRTALDYKFLNMDIVGTNLTGSPAPPVVDLSQSSSIYNYGLDFTGCTISAAVTQGGASPGHICIQVAGAPADTPAYTFVKTDGMRFLSGDTSVYITNSGYQYPAIGWICDNTVNGPVSTVSTFAIDPLLGGRTGAWIPATVTSPWSGSLSYRINAEDLVELKGHASCSNSTGGTLFTLKGGYIPGQASSGPTLNLPAVLLTSGGGTSGIVTVASTGAVACSVSASQSSMTVYLDGLMFQVN